MHGTNDYGTIGPVYDLRSTIGRSFCGNNGRLTDVKNKIK